MASGSLNQLRMLAESDEVLRIALNGVGSVEELQAIAREREISLNTAEAEQWLATAVGDRVELSPDELAALSDGLLDAAGGGGELSDEQLQAMAGGLDSFSGIGEAISDQRLKTEIEPADLSLCYAVIKNLPLMRFKWKDSLVAPRQNGDRRRLGWIAQDVETVFPKSVQTRRLVVSGNSNAKSSCSDGRPREVDVVLEDCRTMNPDQLYASMYGAIQMLMAQVETLQEQVDQLRQALR